jgi:peptidyl-prolyl cis-trans isomerase C
MRYGKLPLVAVSTAVLLGAALFSLPGKGMAETAAPAAAAATQGDPVVATVNGENIKRSDVLAFISTLPEQYKSAPIDQLFPKVRDEIIRDKLIDKKAAAANLAADPEVTKTLAKVKEEVIRNVYIERQVNPQVNDAALKAAYKNMVDKTANVQEVHARHILLDSEDKAKDVIKQLDGGAKWDDVAKNHSSGDLGYFAKGEMVPEVENAAFALDAGKYTETPVKTQLGWHVIQVLDKRKRPAPAFEAVKPQLEAQLRQEAFQSLLEQWQKGADIKKFDINGQPEKDTGKTKG